MMLVDQQRGNILSQDTKVDGKESTNGCQTAKWLFVYSRLSTKSKLLSV